MTSKLDDKDYKEYYFQRLLGYKPYQCSYCKENPDRDKGGDSGKWALAFLHFYKKNVC